MMAMKLKSLIGLNPLDRPLLIIPKFNNINLCVASTLEHYLTVTSTIINNNDCLFLTIKKPYKKASKDTI
ncbi:Protein of unknown function, partial [Cotesia congregata]